MTEEEVDNAEGTLIDAYMVALEELNSDDDSAGGKRESDHLRKAFMGR